MKRLFRIVCFASNDATLSCGCDVKVLHGYCPSQPNSIKCCPGSTKESDHEACDDDVEAGLSTVGSGSGGSGSGGNVNININVHTNVLISIFQYIHIYECSKKGLDS